MPQRPTVRRRQKARRTKKLDLWRQKQASQQAQPASPKKKDTKKDAKN